MRWRILGKGNLDILEQLLANRGLKTKKQRQEFLHPQNPYRLTTKDVGIAQAQFRKAIVRLKQAIKNKEKIIVYGDYDTDGVCATAIMWEAIHQQSDQVMPFIPSREQGYGLKVEKIESLAKQGVKLIVTVDQGIVHNQQVARANKLGIDVIVTDHHQPGKKLPRAHAIVHTTKLAGVGVAWFLAREFLQQKNQPDLDLVTIGTITDMVSLLGANRSLTTFGLKSLAQTGRTGLRALYQAANLEGRPLGSFEVGYLIGPRLNASGRMADPMEALRLVCTADSMRATTLAQQVNASNQKRQRLTGQTLLHARQLWLQAGEKESLIFVYHESYEHGVVGLVASKLKDEFYRPAVVLAPRQDGWVASARSIEEFNIIEAIRQCADLLGAHGGHPLAAGFSVTSEKIDELKQRLSGLAVDKLKGKKLNPTLKIDMELELADINLKFYQQLVKFAPFGKDNPQPVFATRKVRALGVRRVGANQNHLKLQVGQGSKVFDAIGFGLGHFYEKFSSESPIDIAYQLDLNHWNGRSSLQLKLKDIKDSTAPGSE